jgi:hypothetical protein
MFSAIVVQGDSSGNHLVIVTDGVRQYSWLA